MLWKRALDGGVKNEFWPLSWLKKLLGKQHEPPTRPSSLLVPRLDLELSSPILEFGKLKLTDIIKNHPRTYNTYVCMGKYPYKKCMFLCRYDIIISNFFFFFFKNPVKKNDLFSAFFFLLIISILPRRLSINIWPGPPPPRARSEPPTLPLTPQPNTSCIV